jgi:RNA polymerase sigma-70 factor (ECF subfamily)
MSEQLGPDDAAFERLYRAHHRAILAYCARRVSPSDSWDAAAEVFVIAWRRRGEIPTGDGERPWLLGVAYRVLANQRRGSFRRALLVGRVAGIRGGWASWPEELVMRQEDEREIWDALSRLRPLDREILQLTIWEELMPAEIAAVLGISREAVDQRYSRAKRRAAHELERTLHRRRGVSKVISEKEGAA